MKQSGLERAKGGLKSSPEKRDEVRAISVFASMLLGSAVGVPLSVAAGLLGLPGSALPAYDFGGNLVNGISFFGFSTFFSCLTAFLICAYYWKKEGKVNLTHCALSAFTSFSIWVYLALLFTFLFNPLNDLLLQYFTPASVFWDVLLAFFPFMVIFVYIFLPTLRPRIRHQLGLLMTRSFWVEIRENPKKHRTMLIISIALAIVILIEVLSVL